MLQALREKSSGWVATVILGLLIVPFALFGVSDYMTGGANAPAARIHTPPTWWASAPSWWPVSMLWNEEDISAEAFRQRFEYERHQARSLQGDAFDSRAFESIENKRRVLDVMIDERLAALAARDAGALVAEGQLRRSIQSNPQFQVDGEFNPQRYQMMLASGSPPMTPLQYEARLREDLARQSYLGRLALSGFMTPKARDEVLRLMLETRDLAVLAIPLEANTAAVTDAEREAWYKTHAARYQSEEKVSLEYIELDAGKVTPAAVDEASLRQRYQDQIARYTSAERRQLAHILVPVEGGNDKAAQEKAAGLAAQARAGEDFAKLAAAHSADSGSRGNGGALGWIARDGSMPKPFEEAAFALEKDAVSAPVKTDAGWHVIKAVAIEGGTSRSFEDVRAELEQELQATARERAYNDLQSTLVDEMMKNPSGFAEVAARHGLEVKKAEGVARGNGLLATPAVERDVFTEARLKDGYVSNPIPLNETTSVMLRVTAHEPVKALTLAQVKEQVEAEIRRDRASKAAEATATAVMAELKAGKTLAEVAAARKLRLETLNGVQRGMPVFGAEASPAIFQQGVNAEGQSAPVSVALEDGSRAVFQVTAVKAGDLAELPPGMAEQMGQQFQMAQAQNVLTDALAAMRKHRRVSVNESQL